MFLLCLPEGVFWWCPAVRKRQEIKEREKRYKRWGRKREENEGGGERRPCNILHHLDHEFLRIAQIKFTSFLHVPS